MLLSVHISDVAKQLSRLLTKNLSDSHALPGVSVAYLIIANANERCRKKRFLWVKNYLKT
jgi:hypothetical protein